MDKLKSRLMNIIEGIDPPSQFAGDMWGRLESHMISAGNDFDGGPPFNVGRAEVDIKKAYDSNPDRVLKVIQASDSLSDIMKQLGIEKVERSKVFPADQKRKAIEFANRLSQQGFRPKRISDRVTGALKITW